MSSLFGPILSFPYPRCYMSSAGDSLQSGFEGFRPGRLWSLWEMREHNAKLWLRTTKQILRSIAILKSVPNGSVNMEQTVYQVLRLTEAQCREIGLTVSATMAEESLAVLSSVKPTDNTLILGEMETLHDTIEGELKSILFLRVSPEFAKYYQTPQLFGPDVSDKFSSAIRDIEAGGKALAAGLGTASVYHMMRVMEVGLRALAKPLGIPYAPSWESYLTQIDKKIGQKHKTKGVKWKRDEPFFRDAYGDLVAVKIAWRNPTMHIVRHYDQEDAEDVLRAVRRFMKRLAERFRESKPINPRPVGFLEEPPP